MYEISITVDTNDADYNTLNSEISEEDLNKLRPLIDAVKNFEPYTVEVNRFSWTFAGNFPWGEYCHDLGQKSAIEYYSDFDEELIEWLADLCPESEWGFHTIKSITVCPVTEKEILL